MPRDCGNFNDALHRRPREAGGTGKAAVIEGEDFSRFHGTGLDEKQAEAITSALRDTHDADPSRLATKEHLSAVEARLSADIGMIRAEMEILRRDLTIRLGGMMFVAAGFPAAIKFFG